MKILVTEMFLSHIPRGKETFVLQKMSQFVKDYVEYKKNMFALLGKPGNEELKAQLEARLK